MTPWRTPMQKRTYDLAQKRFVERKLWIAQHAQWHHTPAWVFWRPSWRRLHLSRGYVEGADRWEYQTNQQRARTFLADQFNGGTLWPQ